MFKSLEFQAMQSSLDALWMKQKTISQNIANYETPGYKAKSLHFEDVLKDARQDGGSQYDFKATVTTQDNTSMRPDGNNVDIEKESLELYQTYLQSAYLNQKISGQFNNIRYVLNQTVK
ncbi:flagellar basal body rod protein FlgB [Oscillospiraceae bacterium PP1C4]